MSKNIVVKLYILLIWHAPKLKKEESETKYG